MSEQSNSCRDCLFCSIWEQGGTRFCVGPQTEWHEWTKDQIFEKSMQIENAGIAYCSPLTCSGQRNSAIAPFHELIKACEHWTHRKTSP